MLGEETCISPFQEWNPDSSVIQSVAYHYTDWAITVPYQSLQLLQLTNWSIIRLMDKILEHGEMY
jgi:hypothetical protein